MEICEELGIPTKVAPFTKTDLLDADEIVIMSTTALMCRCTKIDDKPVGGKDPDILNRISSVYVERILRETE